MTANPHRTFTLLTTVLSVVGLLIVAVFNFAVNPFGQYPTRLLKPIVQQARLEKRELLERRETPPEGLIFGSSRVYKLEPAYLRQKTGVEFINLGVNHGRPRDFLALLRSYVDRFNSFPREVIIGVDLESLIEPVPLDARITSIPDLASHVPEYISFNEKISRWTDLLSLKQTQKSVSSFARFVKSSCRTTRNIGIGSDNPSDSNAMNDVEMPSEYFSRDGVITYRTRDEQIANGSYDFEGALAFNLAELQRIYQSEPKTSLREWDALIETVRFTRSHRCNVVLFIPPCHPRIADSLKPLPAYQAHYEDVKTLLVNLAEQNECKLLDFQSIDSFEGIDSEFYDGIHPSEINTRKMIDRIVGRKGELAHAIQ